MFLRCTQRKKDGKEHRYWSIVENRRCAGGKIVQRPVLYLGEVNDSQREGWCRVIEAFDEDRGQQRALALFVGIGSFPIMPPITGCRCGLRSLNSIELASGGRAGWGANSTSGLGSMSSGRSGCPIAGKAPAGAIYCKPLVCYQLIDPGSEWRLHRQWFEQSAMGDLLGEDYSLVEKNALYRSLDKLLVHKSALFDHLSARWKDLFGAKFDVLLYDLTSTYFESDLPFPEGDKRQFGYSRDKRPDCVQVVIALVVTPEGFPLAYEVLAGNTR